MPGAIWGIVNLAEEAVDEARIPYMEQNMEIYKIDRVDRKVDGNIYFACAHQYLIKGAEDEIMPYYDAEKEVYFTADCILDNREDLLASIKGATEDMPDGRLAYQAYIEWGEAFVKRLVGIFSFVVYDKKKNTVLMYTDHTGSRCLHYCKRGDSLVFSTVIGPILQAFGEESFCFCEKWLVACESFRSPDMIIFPGLTAFEGVYQIEAGHYIKVSEQKLEKIRYWNPIKEVKAIQLSGDEEYKTLFLDTFRACVKAMLRSEGNTAATLSSGLDSSAVVCMAAPILAEQGQKLYTYTSVPLDDFERTEGFNLVDESDGPKNIAKEYPNVIPSFVSCEGKTAFSEIERFVNYLEVPGKSNANLVWMDEIYQKAREQDCRVVLKGQFGNSTISYGAILSLVYQRLRCLDITGAKEAVRAFRRRRGVTKENVLRVAKMELKEKLKPDMSVMEESFVRADLLEKYDIKKTIRKMLVNGGGSAMDSAKEHKNFMYSLRIYQHLGLYDTKLGLMHGIVLRDPTKDKRIIELCMALPIECFVNNGVERRMVREYMDGIVPASIRNDVKHRGLQSADFVHRLNKQWNVYKEEIIKLLGNEIIYNYLDKEKVQKLAERLKDAEYIADKAMAQDVTVLQSFCLFLEQYEKVQRK